MENRALAHQVREEMYAPLEELSYEEVEWLDQVSGDLYLLHGEEVFLPSKLTPKELIEDLKVAQEREDGEAILKLLRQAVASSRVFRAHFRANAYAMLGFPRLSLMFRSYANANVTNQAEYSLLLLNDLWRFGVSDLARYYASRLLLTSSPEVRLFSAIILLSSARALPPEDAKPYVGKCIEALERLGQSSDYNQLHKREKTTLFMSLGSCYDYLRDEAKARQAYDKGLAVSPNAESLLVLRGTLLLSSDPTAAAADFQKAVRLKTKVSLPYLILTRDALIAREFRRGLKLSKAAYAHATNDRARAQAVEFMAIGEYELGRPLELVLGHFDWAHQLDPSNDIILQNRAAVVLDATEKANRPVVLPKTTEEDQNLASNLALVVEEDDAVSESIINYIDNLPRFEKTNRKELDQVMQGRYALAA